MTDVHEYRDVNFGVGDHPFKMSRMVLEPLGISMNQYCGKL